MAIKIAIVGRPNVGKSTLFNRLTGRRAALVSEQPGLTRDRREGEAEIAGQKALLIDTAGLEEAEAGTLSARMRAQTEAALAEADIVLFLIDARAGVIGADEIIAGLVRKAAKPVILVANKSEGRAGTEGYYDAYALGLGDPVPISAEHGEGIGALFGAIAAACEGLAGREEVEPEAEGERPLRIAIVGRPNAGKSTLVNALLGEDRMITGPEAGITRDAIASPLLWEERDLLLFDTAGLRRKARISEQPEKLSVSDALRAIRFAEVVVLLVDAGAPFEKQDLQIADLVMQEGRALVIAVNKWDLVKDKQATLRELRLQVEELLPQGKGLPVVPISALSSRGLDKLMAAVFEVYDIWNRRTSTGALNRWLTQAVEQHAPPAVQGRRIKIRYITQPHARPPTFVVFCSRPEKLPESYRRYLINGLREAFDLPAVPIRLSLRKGSNPYAERKEEGRR